MSSRGTFISLIIFSLILISTGALWAQTLTFENVDGFYESYELADISRILGATIARNGEGAVDYVLGFGPGNSASSSARYATSTSGTRLYYHIYDNDTDRNELVDVGDTGTGTALATGSIDEEPDSFYVTETVSFTVFVPGNQVVQDGSYSDNLTVSLYEGQPGSTTLQATSTFVLEISSYNSVVRIRPTPVGGSYEDGSTSMTLDYGYIVAGEYQEADLAVESTVGYEINFSSASGGVLERVGGAAADPAISYLMDFDAQTDISLASEYGTVNYAATGPAGRSHRLRFTIQDFEASTIVDGEYEDTITMVISVY